jgi:hypothetical protein
VRHCANKRKSILILAPIGAFLLDKMRDAEVDYCV